MRPRVVIIGARIRRTRTRRARCKTLPADVTVIDRTNHHVFQPLLYQVATATLDADRHRRADSLAAARSQRNTEVLLSRGDVDRAGRANRSLRRRTRAPLRFSHRRRRRASFVLRPRRLGGARSRTQERRGRDRAAPPLAARVRARRADDRRRRARGELTFVIIGGGPTGVELAGMLPTIARFALPEGFPSHRHDARANHSCSRAVRDCCPTFPEDLSAHARRDLIDLGVDVRTNTLVTNVGDGFVEDRRRAYRVTHDLLGGGQCGVVARRIARRAARPDGTRRGERRPQRSRPAGGLRRRRSGRAADERQASAGRRAGGNAERTQPRRETSFTRFAREGRERFRYRNKGDLATIGRYRAVGVLAGQHLSGWLAWWTWLLVHIMYLAGFRNRLSVLLEWGYSFFTYQRGTRLITADPRTPSPGDPLQPPKW